MAKIDNGFGGMMRLCNWIPTAKRTGATKNWLKKRAERLAERLRLLGIGERSVTQYHLCELRPAHLGETDCSE